EASCLQFQFPNSTDRSFEQFSALPLRSEVSDSCCFVSFRGSSLILRKTLHEVTRNNTKRIPQRHEDATAYRLLPSSYDRQLPPMLDRKAHSEPGHQHQAGKAECPLPCNAAFDANNAERSDSPAVNPSAAA